MRKFFSMILAVALPCAIFTSCNDDDDDEPKGTTPDVPEETVDPYASVDLGLSVLWAEYNVDATKAEDYGGYYAWGETEQKETYTEGNYTFCDADGNYSLPGDISGTDYDVAHVKWGGDWRMPTSAECQELVNNCTWVRNSLNGINGYTVTGPNGNSIFLPAAGYKVNSSTPSYEGDNGSYWTSNPNVQSDGDAYYIVMGSRYRVDYSWAFAGQSVRPVKTAKK